MFGVGQRNEWRIDVVCNVLFFCLNCKFFLLLGAGTGGRAVAFISFEWMLL